MKTVVIGVGNILFKDEGIGIYTAKYLEENLNYSEDLEIIDGGTLGFKLMTYYQEYDKVIILDTISIKDTSGSIYNLPAKELLELGSYRQTAHEVEVVEMLEICSILENMAEVKLIGVIPEDIISVEIGLTNRVKSSFEAYINECIKEIKVTANISLKEQKVSLEEIIDSYANPTNLKR